jgi:hypothetical protein
LYCPTPIALLAWKCWCLGDYFLNNHMLLVLQH